MSKAGTLHYKLIRYLAAGCGWLIVFYEWLHVSQQAPGRDEMTLVLVLTPSLFLIHTGAIAWISHSKRLAARGKRGLITRYTSPVYSQDHLGRKLMINEKSLESKEIEIIIDGEVKSYAPAAETSPESKELGIALDRDVKSYAPADEVWG